MPALVSLTDTQQPPTLDPVTWGNHIHCSAGQTISGKGTSLSLPQAAFQQVLTDLLPLTPQQKHTSSGKPWSWKPTLRAQLPQQQQRCSNSCSEEGMAAPFRAALSSLLLYSTVYLPSTAIQQFCCSAHQCHTSNNESHTRDKLLK